MGDIEGSNPVVEAKGDKEKQKRKDSSSKDLSTESMINLILDKIPPQFNIEQISLSYPISKSNSYNTVLIQECQWFNNLLSVITDQLIQIKRALKGEILITQKLEETFNSILKGLIPATWLKVSYPSLKPLSSYLSDLKLRIKFFQNWVDEWAPTVFWISGFFFTQSFLTAVQQNYARKRRIEIDQLWFYFSMTQDDKTDYTVDLFNQKESNIQPIEDAAIVCGLYMEGGRWDFGTQFLAESYPKVLTQLFPLIVLKPSEELIELKGFWYDCPMYKTSERRGVLSTTGHSTNFVMYVQLPSFQPVEHWIKWGVALLCQLSE